MDRARQDVLDRERQRKVDRMFKEFYFKEFVTDVLRSLKLELPEQYTYESLAGEFQDSFESEERDRIEGDMVEYFKELYGNICKPKH